MRTPLMAGNWKMHKRLDEAVELIEGLLLRLDGAPPEGREVLVCPPYTALATVASLLEGSGIFWGGQNMHAEPQGAFTGEISAPLLVDLGCTHVILGHSERRQLFGESDEGVNRKLHAALAAGLVPLLAVGETLEQREAGEAESTVISQLEGGLEGVERDAADTLVVAYEPVWAIGTGRTASPADAQEMHAAIRRWLASRYDEQVAEGTRILYGGSVKPANVDELMSQPDIDGALVGGASLDAESFARIARFEPVD